MPRKLVVHMVPVDLFVSALVCGLSPPKDVVGPIGLVASGFSFISFAISFQKDK